MAERGSQEYPETNHSFTMYYNPSEPRPETESDNRRRLSSVTLEEVGLEINSKIVCFGRVVIFQILVHFNVSFYDQQVE